MEKCFNNKENHEKMLSFMRFFKIFVRDTHIYWYYCHFHHSLPTHSRGGVPERCVDVS